MDSLTQIVVGIATVEAVAGKELKNKSFLYGAILGTLPDLDIYIGKLFNYEMELAFHRSFTHSLLGFIVLSPFLGYLFHRLHSSITLKRWILICFACFVTHTGIDLFTSWGVQLFYPHPARISFKTIFVVDPLYTLPWLVALLFLFRTKEVYRRAKLLRIGFLLSSLYLIWGIVIKLYVSNLVKDQLNDQHIVYTDYIVKPTIANSILWNINVKTTEGYYLSDYSLLDKSEMQFTFYPSNTELEQKMSPYSSVQKLFEVTEGWYTLTALDTNIYALNDLRFGLIEKADLSQQFAFSYKIEETAEAVEISEMPKTFRDGRKSIQNILQRIKGQ